MRFARTVVAMLVIGLAACGTRATDGPSPSSAPSSSPAATAAATAGSATSVVPSPGSATSAVPSPIAEPGMQVLAEQFTAFVGAGAPGDCDHSLWEQPLASLPYVGLPEQRQDAVLGSVEPLCLVGFDLTREIALAIAVPDGTVRTLAVTLTGTGRPVDLLGGPDEVTGFGVDHGTVTEGSLDWWIRPDAPTGEYGFVAVQEPLAAAGSVWVAPGTEPWLAAVPADDVAWRRFAVSGFPPGPAAFGIYRDTHDPGDEPDGGTVFELVADLGVLDVDGSGAAVLDVPVDGLVAGEWYCVDSPALADRCAGGMGFLDPGYVPWD